MHNSHRKPKQVFNPQIAKIPRTDPSISTAKQTVHWSFAIFDNMLWHDDVSKEEVFVKVADHMKAYEGRTWAEIETQNAKHDHPVPVKNLTAKAQARLQALKQDDVEKLWRFRFSNLQRIWGIRDGRLFKVIWWDPEHKICPSNR